MKLSQINRAVEEKVLARFPRLQGHVHFDTVFHSASAMATVFETTVSVTDSEDYQFLMNNRPDPSLLPYWANESGHVLRELLTYQADENNEFKLGFTRFMIGDGDDSGAVWETGSWSMTMWVRILELSQGDYRND